MSYEKIRKNKLILKGQGGLAIQPAIPGSFVGQEMTGYTWTGAVWVPTSSYNAVHGNKSQSNAIQSDEYKDESVIADEKLTEQAEKQQDATVKLSAQQQQNMANTNSAFQALGFNGVNTTAQQYKTDENGNIVYDENGNPIKTGMSEGGQIAMGIASQAVSKALNVADEMTMGDKNFSAQSQALDSAVHGVSGALMKSGNPYAMAAGAAIEGLNFITKAGGKTVPGYEVDINNSGYGNLGHQESSSGRIWDSWTGKTDRKLAKRNEQARMALAAQDVSQDIEYQQEARANSVTNVLQANQIALAGGIDTSLLGN